MSTGFEIRLDANDQEVLRVLAETYHTDKLFTVELSPSEWGWKAHYNILPERYLVYDWQKLLDGNLIEKDADGLDEYRITQIGLDTVEAIKAGTTTVKPPVWNGNVLDTPEGRLQLEILAAKRAGYEAREMGGKWSLFLDGKQVGTFKLSTEDELWHQSRLRSSTDANATIFLLNLIRDTDMFAEYEICCRAGKYLVTVKPTPNEHISSGWHSTLSRAGIIAFLLWSDTQNIVVK